MLDRILTRLRAVLRPESVVPRSEPLPTWVTDAWADPSWAASPEEQAVLDALHADDYDAFPEVSP